MPELDAWDEQLEVRKFEGEHYIKLVRRPPLPLVIPLLIGEAAHQLRSALDSMVYDLAVAEEKAAGHNTAASPFKGTQFLIEVDA